MKASSLNVCRERVSLRKVRTWAPKAPNNCQGVTQKGARAAWYLPPKVLVPFSLRGNENIAGDCDDNADRYICHRILNLNQRFPSNFSIE